MTREFVSASMLSDQRSDNIIHYVEAFKPNKAAALDYLSNTSTLVEKYAHVSQQLTRIQESI